MRIGFYYTHYQCLGHTTRVFSLISSLKRILPRSETFSIQGSLPQTYLSRYPFDHAYSLPLAYFKRANFYEPFRAAPSSVEVRAKECLSLVRRQSPDIFFTEYFPFGRADCRSELLPSLAYLGRSGKKIFSSVGYPVVSNVGGRLTESFFRMYDRIFVHAPRLEIDYVAATYPRGKMRTEYLELFRRHEELISFTGYVIPEPLPFLKGHDEPVAFVKGKINVLVTRGAGAYCPEIILTALEAGDLLGPDYFFTLISGPASTDEEWRAFQRALGKKKVLNARLIRSTAGFEKAVVGSDVCVCPAPYNTSVLLMKHKQRAVLIPMEGSKLVVLREQIARARMLNDVLGARVLPFDQLDAKRLALEIKRSLGPGGKPKAVPTEWLKGADSFIKQFRKDTGGR